MADDVRFLTDDDTIAFLRSIDVDPGQLAQTLFREEVRRLKAAERHERLTEAGGRLPRSAADTVRDDRDR